MSASAAAGEPRRVPPCNACKSCAKSCNVFQSMVNSQPTHHCSGECPDTVLAPASGTTWTASPERAGPAGALEPWRAGCRRDRAGPGAGGGRGQPFTGGAGSAARPALVPAALSGLGAAMSAGTAPRRCRGRVRAVETGPARGAEAAGNRGSGHRGTGGGRRRGGRGRRAGAGQRTAQDAGVRHQRGTGGADFHERPHLGNGRIVTQHEQHAAHAVHLAALVGRALRLPAGTGGVRVDGGRAGVRPDMGLGEAAQRGEVAGPRRHGAGRGAGDRRGAVAVAGDANGPCASRTSRGR